MSTEPQALRTRVPQCGYVLYGVQERRCPDCGRPFELTELNVNLLRIDEEGRLQPKETRT